MTTEEQKPGKWVDFTDCLEKEENVELRAMIAKLPKACDGLEQKAFEEWAKKENYDMQEHPLHYIFLDQKTYAARMGWNACIRYMTTLLTTKE